MRFANVLLHDRQMNDRQMRVAIFIFFMYNYKCKLKNEYIEGVRGKRMLRSLMKRETGVNPVRTRHCDKGVCGK